MWSFLIAPAFQPFTVAALVMLGLLAVEIVTALFGVAASSLLDTTLGIDTGATAFSDDQGRFSFSGLPPGPHAMQASDDGYGNARGSVTVVVAVACPRRCRQHQQHGTQELAHCQG